ncbi:MFS transporter [Edaphovirga cremea]|uniref:MFS transporter n=1 Tax=Edaphovirga cremea TaxID=2267246 RepID=UPI000DEFF026|nr:MFS transporter [Edaphovirga cremea]
MNIKSAQQVMTGRSERFVVIMIFISCFLGMMADGADLIILSFCLTKIKAEFGLTNIQIGGLGSVTLIGMAIGGIFGGWAADRFGRVKTVVWSIAVFSIGTAAIGFSSNYEQIVFFRFISGLGLGAEYVVCNTLMAEFVPTKWRTTVLGALQSGWSVGYIVATALAAYLLPLYGWRWLFYLCLIPIVLAVFIRAFIPEPPGWLALQREKRAQGKSGRVQKRGLIKTMAENPLQRRVLLLWILTSCALQFGYFGVNTWFPAYLEQELAIDFRTLSGYMVGVYTAMILGKVIAGWLADYFGRRIVFSVSAVATAFFLPVVVLYNTPDNIAYLLVIFGFLYGAPYGVNATYMTESFETSIRGSAVGFAYNMGRVGAAAAPLLIGYLASWSIGLGFLIMGGAYLLCGAIPALFIKEKLYDPQSLQRG